MSIQQTDQTPLTVLVVDDDEVIQRLVAGILKPTGLTIITVANGEAGIAIAREQPVDLILLDNEMPGASGLDILHLLKSDPQLSSVPVIMVTGSEGSKVLSAGFVAGAVDYLRKPFSSAELRARVNSVLERQRLLTALTSAARTDRLTG
ncbi:MAG: response regulator, partial [Gemmatimonadaceae bacterium]